MIADSLFAMETSPIFKFYAHSKCNLSRQVSNHQREYLLLANVDFLQNLKDISELKSYNFIQYLNLSCNTLTTLEPLGKMPFLQHLNVSHNSIEKLLDFDPPLYLSYVNYSNNLIIDIPDLTNFWSIVHLDLSKNKIRQIKGLKNLK